MTPEQIHQIKKFINDPAMSSAVHDSVYQFFLKRRKTDDVQMLATERLALFLLEDAWKDLQRYAVDEKEKEEGGNIGL